MEGTFKMRGTGSYIPVRVGLAVRCVPYIGNEVVPVSRSQPSTANCELRTCTVGSELVL